MAETEESRVLKTLANHPTARSLSFLAANSNMTEEKFGEVYRRLVKGGFLAKWDEIWSQLPKEKKVPKPRTGDLFEGSEHPTEWTKRRAPKSKERPDLSYMIPEER